MIWFLTLALLTAPDKRMPIGDARTVDAPTYRIQVRVKGVCREYARTVKDATIADALGSLPPGWNPNRIMARICLHRGRQLLDVDWQGIAYRGDCATNYQLAAGDILEVELDGKGP